MNYGHLRIDPIINVLHKKKEEAISHFCKDGLCTNFLVCQVTTICSTIEIDEIILLHYWVKPPTAAKSKECLLETQPPTTLIPPSSMSESNAVGNSILMPARYGMPH